MTMQPHLGLRLLAGAAVSSLLCLAGAPALAQPAMSSDTTASTDLGEVVVTARKRNESLLEVPVAITAISGADLAARGVINYSDLQKFTPGFRFMESGSSSAARGFNTFVLRGIYPGSDSPDRQAVSIFLDGIPVGGSGSIPGVQDIAQVEVVNGPQSAYFGRSTFAGAVNFITRQPGFDFKGNVSAQVASYGSYQVSGGIEGPIWGDKLAARVSASTWKQGAEYKNFGFGGRLGERQTDALSGSFLFKPTDRLRIKGFASVWHDHDGLPAQALLRAADYNCNARPTAGAFNYVCGAISSAPVNRIAQNNTGPSTVVPSVATGQTTVPADFIDDYGLERRSNIQTLSLDYDLPAGFVLSANGSMGNNKSANIVDIVNRFTPPTATIFLVPYDIENSSAEIRVASDSSKKLKALIGTSLYHQQVISGSVSNVNGVYRPGAAKTRTRTDTLGFFGALSYKLFDRLTLSAEGRFQTDRVGSQALVTNGIGAKGVVKSFTPRFIAQYDVTSRVNVYGSYSEGTRPAQFNAAAYTLPASSLAQLQAQTNVPLVVPEERLTMYEIGLKGRFFENRLELLAALYSGRWVDKQIQVTLTYLTTSVNNIIVVLPAGQVNLQGIELQSHLRVTDALRLDATFNYAGTNIRKTTCTDCAAITGNSTPVGTRLPRYPAYAATFSANYERHAFGDFTGYLLGDLIYTGKQYDTEANVAWTRAATTVNLRLGVRNERYTAEVFGVNVFDNTTPTSIGRSVDQVGGTNTMLLAPPHPATFGVRVGYNF